MEQKFVSESLKPVNATANIATTAAGGPVLPHEFKWRDSSLVIGSVIDSWSETGSCTHGSGERYVRKHWFEVETADHRKARIYFERKPRGKKFTDRWWLFSIENNTNRKT